MTDISWNQDQAISTEYGDIEHSWLQSDLQNQLSLAKRAKWYEFLFYGLSKPFSYGLKYWPSTGVSRLNSATLKKTKMTEEDGQCQLSSMVQHCKRIEILPWDSSSSIWRCDFRKIWYLPQLSVILTKMLNGIFS